MAEFLWTFAVQEVLKKLVKLAAEQIGVAWGLEKELSKLSNLLLKAEATLRDIDRQRLHHESVRMWVDNLQHAVYEADDLLDELVYEDLRQKVETEKTKEKVRKFFSPSDNSFLFRYKMTKKLKEVTETLCQLYHETSSFGVVALVGQESTETNKNILKQIRETTSTLNSEVIGREAEVSNIVKLAIDSSNENPMSIIPIVGMGGVGKTTLAKMIFNHELIKGHFDETIWVCVSEPFIITNILEEIFHSLTNTSNGFKSKENLLKGLQEKMQGKSYFLVLDDVWNEEASLWGELKDCLKESAGKSGNVIIVTTRSVKVANIMETTLSHHVNKLSDDQCWSLFKESAKANGLLMNPELKTIRVELVKKIDGVPLIAKVLGGAVTFEGNFERWVTEVKRVVKNISKDDKNFVLSILKLSVDRLPLLSLKQCFAYCSNFPKDHLFDKESLIQMWIAQGFVQPQEGDDEMMIEDRGEEYFNFLLSRSLFEVVIKGLITRFTMHDLIHDIACDISNHQKVESSLNNSGEKSVSKLRTLICGTGYKVFHEDLKHHACLRVLVVDTIIYDKNFSGPIGMFKHLRYLDISDISGDFELKDVESIDKLYNLQTLKLGERIPLPKNLRKLVKLRHLQFSRIKTKKMPLHMSQLIHLQTLSAYEASYEQGHKIEELGPLKNLKGSLKLLNLGKVKSKEEAIGARLIEKKNLIDLVLTWNSSSKEKGNHWNNSSSGEEDNNDDNCFHGNSFEVLKGLQPHHNLQSLSINLYSGQVFPNSIFVEKLVKIFLKDCGKCEMLPMLGQLPNLEELDISSLDSVRSIGREFYGDKDDNNQRVSFPKLKKISLHFLQNLEQWEDISNGIAFPHLEIVSIEKCCKLMSVPHCFVSLQTLVLEGCKELRELPNQLEHYNSIKSLKISDCPNLSLNVCNWSNLEEMKITGCMQDYDFSPFTHLCSITDLSLTDSLENNATELPQQLQHLTTLKTLSIRRFNGIEALPEWLGNFASLEALHLSDCKNLKRLPSKEVMLCLTKLNKLNVGYGCPLGLQLRQGHPEMAKLSHLPKICDDLKNFHGYPEGLERLLLLPPQSTEPYSYGPINYGYAGEYFPINYGDMDRHLYPYGLQSPKPAPFCFPEGSGDKTSMAEEDSSIT